MLIITVQSKSGNIISAKTLFNLTVISGSHPCAEPGMRMPN